MYKAYSFECKKGTNEIHIFQGTYTLTAMTYQPEALSICKKKIRKASERISDATCLKEQETREKAVELGRNVCGNCISNLYKTY